MKQKPLYLALMFFAAPIVCADNLQLQDQIHQLQQQTQMLQQQLKVLKKQLTTHSVKNNATAGNRKHQKKSTRKPFQNSIVSIHTSPVQTGSLSYYPTALIADHKVVTYIAGTPVVTSPYTGERPAFDGSDYIVNISSINRDIRLMQQRRLLYNAYDLIGYPMPQRPIVAISGKAEPVASFNRPGVGNASGDLTLGSNELDVAATINENVEGFMSIAYDDSPPPLGGQRIANSAFNLNMGFVNIGNLNKSPLYLTAGQLYAPYGRYATSMISSPITMTLARTKTRPIILGYKSQGISGPYVAIYGFHSDTTEGNSAIGGVNLGYIFKTSSLSGDIGGGLIGNMADSQGMQNTGSPPETTFGGFGSPSNGSEVVGKVPGLNIHANINFSRYNLTAEWVGASRAFNPQDLSFNGEGARPQAAQLEAGMTFRSFDRPSSIGLGYQWSKETLALNLPKNRISAVYNISIWKDTVESLEYRHDVDFGINQYANGAAAPYLINDNTVGTGKASDTVIAQIGVYF